MTVGRNRAIRQNSRRSIILKVPRCLPGFVINENVLSGESISFGYETAGKWVRAIKAQGVSFRLYMNDIFRISSFKEERGTDYPFSKNVSLSVGVRF